MGIALIAGRPFDSRDNAHGAPVIIVNKEFARRYVSGENAVGQRLHAGFDDDSVKREIVGVVGDVKQTTLGAATEPAVYIPESQMAYPALTLVIRTAGDPVAALPAVRRELRATNPALALAGVRTLDAVFSDSLARQRFSMIVLGVFAGAALLLALIGLYGVIALSVGQRTREIGVRVALGARPRDVLALVLSEGARVTAIGLGLGLLAALGVTRVLHSLLYGVSATNALIYAGAAVAVGAIALIATYLPARRAAHVDPVRALRIE
jgi:putative ABC transport system permease protein